jgi:hypothetical protein|tara:strand:+ start:370 stop:492 length:123 start_codon:yes stop_codon:yes gene_type:complete
VPVGGERAAGKKGFLTKKYHYDNKKKNLKQEQNKLSIISI